MPKCRPASASGQAEGLVDALSHGTALDLTSAAIRLRTRPIGFDAPDTDAYARTYAQGRPTITTITATEARKQLYKLLDDVSQSHEPVQITGKRGNAVLVGEDDWRAVQETLYLVSIPGMRESIIEGIATPAEELDGELRW